MKIYFVRHGQTEWNIKRIFQGIKNSPLTNEGREQAKKLGEKLKDKKFTHLYSSPLGRAKETLELIIKNREDKKYETIEEFREINMGEMEGVPREEFKSKHPVEFNSFWWDAKNYNPAAYEGESFQEVMVRVEKGMKFLEDNHKNDDEILIVSHGMTLQGIFAYINNETYESFSEEKVPKNTSLTIVEYKNNEYKILDFSNTSHLD